MTELAWQHAAVLAAFLVVAWIVSGIGVGKDFP